jgi:DNA-directed RNA polymerase specialized sigma24 family protein
MEIKPFDSSCYLRILAIIRPAIVATFQTSNFSYVEYDIDEVSSQTLEKVAKNWHNYDEKLSKLAWFSTIAKNCAYTYISDQSHWKECCATINLTTKDGELYEMDYANYSSPKSYYADAELISEERVDIITREINALKGKTKHALMFLSQGYSLSEIQSFLGVENGALRTMISRGRKQLANNKNISAICAEVLGRNSKIINQE